jgi:hypothetical protein
MLLKKIVTVFIIFTFLLSGCATDNRTSTAVGPPPSSSKIYTDNAEYPDQNLTKLDIIIPVFDPGLPEDPDDYEEDNIWPELRRAEANRFAYKLKEALEQTGKFGAVRVTPDVTATGDLYVLGKIIESNGEQVEIDIELVDISGRRWFKDSFDHVVSESFHNDLRNQGLDPYEPVFIETAETIAEQLENYSPKERADLHYLTGLRFGANFSEGAFMPYMSVDRGQYSLISKPSDQDPMLQRVKAIRVRDQLFVDSLQDNYSGFSEQMEESYLMWQAQSIVEVKARREAGNKAIGQAAGGVLLIGLAVLSAVLGDQSDSSAGRTAGTAGAILGGIAGASMIGKSFQTREEMEMHRDTLNELGKSLDMELAPQVIAFEKESVELTGDSREQFMQWRTFLQKIYDEEKTPEVQL